MVKKTDNISEERKKQGAATKDMEKIQYFCRATAVIHADKKCRRTETTLIHLNKRCKRTETVLIHSDKGCGRSKTMLSYIQ